MLLEAALFGFIGGLARASVGFVKYSYKKKHPKFRPHDFIFTFVCSGIIGIFTGLLVDGATLSLLAGYAGTDLIENIYKIKMNTNIKT